MCLVGFPCKNLVVIVTTILRALNMYLRGCTKNELRDYTRVWGILQLPIDSYVYTSKGPIHIPCFVVAT